MKKSTGKAQEKITNSSNRIIMTHWGQTPDEFCRKISDVLDNPSFETKQRL